jgi:hypothetical protein
MSTQDFALIATPAVSLIIFVGTLLWNQRRDRNRPAFDRSQIEDIVRKTTRWRDARLAQYDRYFDEQDLPWHRAMTRLVAQVIDLLEQAKAAGFLPPDVVIPPPPPPSPVLPEPPPYD